MLIQNRQASLLSDSGTCSVGEGTLLAGLTGGRVADEEAGVARRTVPLCPRRRQLHGPLNGLAADLGLDPLVHELRLQRVADV